MCEFVFLEYRGSFRSFGIVFTSSLVSFLFVVNGEIISIVLSALWVSCIVFTRVVPHVRQNDRYLMYSLRNCSVNSP